MFTNRSHDFGVVARNAKTQYVFELENPYAVDVHVQSVRASCGCTTPTITKQNLSTYEKGAIVATYNTHAFTGKRGATLTVTFDAPRYAEVRLHVTGYIRSDIELTPNSLSFDSVEFGQEPVRSLSIRSFGNSRWSIEDGAGSTEYVDYQVVPAPAGSGAYYTLSARLKKEAPVGYFNDVIVLRTTDPNIRRLPVRVEGRITGPLSIYPSTLYLGTVPTGGQVTKKLVVRGKEPFRILSVESADTRISCQATGEAKRLHVVPIQFVAGEKTAKVAADVVVETDVKQCGTVTCRVMAAVMETTTLTQARN
jgi:hypothetical protein